MKTQNRFLISVLVIAAIALGNAGSTLYLPAMPVIASHLHTTGALMKLSLSLFLIGFGVSQLFYGPLSDALGRRINLFAGLIIFLIGTLISAQAHSIDCLLLGRLIEGLGIGAANAVGYALMRDIYSGNQLTVQLSYMSVFVGMTPLVAPIIGGYLVHFIAWQACFYFLAALAVILFIAKLYWLPETLAVMNPQACHPKVVFKNYAILLRSPTYIGFAFLSAAAFAGIFTMGSMLPFLLVNQLGIPVAVYGWIAGIPALGFLSGSFVSGKFSQKAGLTRLIFLGCCLSLCALAVGAALNGQHFNAYTLIIPLVVFMFGIGLVLPTGSSGAMAPFPQLAGSEAAILCASMFCFASIFTAIGSHLGENTPLPLFGVLAATSVLALLFLALAKKGLKKNGESK